MTDTSQRSARGSGKKTSKPEAVFKKTAVKKNVKEAAASVVVRDGRMGQTSNYMVREPTSAYRKKIKELQKQLAEKHAQTTGRGDKGHGEKIGMITLDVPMTGKIQRLARGQPFSYAWISESSALDRIDAVRRGLPATVLASVAEDMNVEQGFLIDHLGFARSTIARKVKSNTPLNLRESEGLLGVAQLIGLVETMVSESGAPEDFDAAAWVGQWIARPHPALGNRKPVDLLDTSEGQNLVASILSRAQSGAYA